MEVERLLFLECLIPYKVNDFEDIVKDYKNKMQNVLQETQNIIKLDIPIVNFNEINEKLKLLESNILNNEKEIESKRDNLSNSFTLKDFTSIINEINKLLKSLCFNNFKLIEKDSKYQIVREDNTPVN